MRVKPGERGYSVLKAPTDYSTSPGINQRVQVGQWQLWQPFAVWTRETAAVEDDDAEEERMEEEGG